jgi:hypothetical protein
LVLERDVNHDRTSPGDTDRKVITLVALFFDTVAIGLSTSSEFLDERPPKHIWIETVKLLD